MLAHTEAATYKLNTYAHCRWFRQVIAAIAPSIHATTPEVLLEDTPPDYVCPISRQVMVEPVMLVETGHTYEAAAVQKWLDAKSVCPVSGQKLRSKQTMPNYALKRVIADWAAVHGVTLPPAPTYSDVNTYRSHSEWSAVAAAVSMQDNGSFGAPSAPSAAVGIDIDDIPRSKSSSSAGKLPLRCTRTRWALAAGALLLSVALAIGLGVGLPWVTRRFKGMADFPRYNTQQQHWQLMIRFSIPGAERQPLVMSPYFSLGLCQSHH